MKKVSAEWNLSTFLSISCLIILIGYIISKEIRDRQREDVISDEGVAESPFFQEDSPYPAISYPVPDNLQFAGEPIPIQIPDVKERLDKELQINCYLHSNTIFLIKRANRWLPQMEKILKAYDIPEDFKYLPLIESNLLNVTSYRKAVGYWQILETSGKELGLEISNDVDERYDPLKSTEAACKYLKKAYAKFGDWALVAASYNRGMTGLEKALKSQQVDSYYDLYLNDETSRYVFRILAIKEIVENPVKYGFKIPASHLYEEEPLRYINVDSDISDLISFARNNGTNYKLLKRHNPWLRDDKLKVRKGKVYKIGIPL